ncbi:Zinc finger BED domain-containing protein, partial [Ooceraea biroi]
IHRYLAEPRLCRNADIYTYWNSSPYPCLRKVILKYLSAPPTSVASEQLFNTAGQIYVDRRSNLLGENDQNLLFFTYNIRLFNYNY